MTTHVKHSSTLESRGSRYGTIENNSRVTSNFMKVLEGSPNFDKLSVVHKEVLHMIFHKISRMLCGDMNYTDNPHDIAGYAILLEKYLLENMSEARDYYHGSIDENVRIIPEFMKVVGDSPNYDNLSTVHKKTIYMIFYTVSRILCGNMNYGGNARDIAIYAICLEDHLLENKDN